MTVRNQEDVTAQVEKAAELVAARDRFLRARAGHGGQIARDQADRQEREQRDPVLRVCNREGPDGREEEEVEGEHRRKRRRHGNPQACGGSHEQDDDEKAERDGRRTRCLGPLREHQRERGCPRCPRQACARRTSFSSGHRSIANLGMRIAELRVSRRDDWSV